LICVANLLKATAGLHVLRISPKLEGLLEMVKRPSAIPRMDPQRAEKALHREQDALRGQTWPKQ